MNTTTTPLVRRRGRPTGSTTVKPESIIRRRVHFTIHPHRQPLLAAWLTAQEERGLAPTMADLLERALAGQSVADLSGRGETQPQVYEVDMSGLLDWD